MREKEVEKPSENLGKRENVICKRKVSAEIVALPSTTEFSSFKVKTRIVLLKRRGVARLRVIHTNR